METGFYLSPTGSDIVEVCFQGSYLDGEKELVIKSEKNSALADESLVKILFKDWEYLEE